jgi:hypothetical protein
VARYDIVVHASVELEGATPEEAAVALTRCLRAGVDAEAVVRGLAVWRAHDGIRATPLPGPHPDQLADFFEGVKWSAAMAEAAFRQEVERILAGAFPDAIEGGEAETSGR